MHFNKFIKKSFYIKMSHLIIIYKINSQIHLWKCEVLINWSLKDEKFKFSLWMCNKLVLQLNLWDCLWCPWLIDWWWWWINHGDDDWLTNDCYVNSKTYILRMIFKYYVIYVIIVDYILIVKFYYVLVYLFIFVFVKLTLALLHVWFVFVMILNLTYMGSKWLGGGFLSLETSWICIPGHECVLSIYVPS